MTCVGQDVSQTEVNIRDPHQKTLFGTGVDMYVVPNTYSIRFVIHTAGCTLHLLCLIYNNVYATDSSPRDTGAAFGNCTRLPLMIVHDQ